MTQASEQIGRQFSAAANVKKIWGNIIVNVKDYDAEGDGSTDDKNAIVKAIQAVISAGGGTIVFPKGTYAVYSGISINLNGIEIKIAGMNHGETQVQTRILWRGGAGTMFTFTNGRNVYFDDIEISGYYTGVDSSVLATGSIGIKAEASIIADNCSLNGFEKIVYWNGGFYHKFNRCFIAYTKIGFDNFNANNVVFTKCKVMDVEQLINVTGGNGPLAFKSCSFERFSKILFNTSVGLAAAGISFDNCYFENYPSTTPPSGISGDYTASDVIFGFVNIRVIGCDIVTNGIRRFIYSNTTTRNIMSIGNNILYSSTATGWLQYYIFLTTGIENVCANDVAYPVLTQSGTNTAAYLSSAANLRSRAGVSRVYDPFTKAMVVTNASTTANRPTLGLHIGYPYFDTTLGKPIWWNGTAWIDSTSTVV